MIFFILELEKECWYLEIISPNLWKSCLVTPPTWILVEFLLKRILLSQDEYVDEGGNELVIEARWKMVSPFVWAVPNEPVHFKANICSQSRGPDRKRFWYLILLKLMLLRSYSDFSLVFTVIVICVCFLSDYYVQLSRVVISLLKFLLAYDHPSSLKLMH